MPYRNYDGKTVDELKLELDKKDKEILKLKKKKEKMKIPRPMKWAWKKICDFDSGDWWIVVGVSLVIVFCVGVTFSVLEGNTLKAKIKDQATTWQVKHYGGGEVFCEYDGDYEEDLQVCEIRFENSPSVEMQCTTKGCFR